MAAGFIGILLNFILNVWVEEKFNFMAVGEPKSFHDWKESIIRHEAQHHCSAQAVLITFNRLRYELILSETKELNTDD